MADSRRLEERLAEAEETLEALRRNEVDAVVGRDDVALLRLRRAEAALRAAAAEAEFRLRLSDALRPLSRPHAIRSEACRILGEQLGASRVHYVELDDDGEHGTVVDEFHDGVSSVAGPHRIDDYGAAAMEELRAGRTVAVEDVASDPRLTDAERRRIAELGALASLLILPLVKDGRAAAALVVHRPRPGAWTNAEIALVEETAERTWETVARARAEAAVRENELRLRRLADSMPQLVWIAERDGSVVYYNSRAALYGGIERTPAGSWAWQPVVAEEDLPATRAAWSRALATGERYEIEHRIRMADGSLRWHLSRAERVGEDSAALWYGTATDVHATREMVEALRDADRHKNEFLAVLGHELRNPLAPIRSGLELLRRADDDRQVAEEARAMMQRQLAVLTRLIDDLLDVSRAARGHLRLERRRLDVGELVRNALETSRPQLAAAGHRVSVDLPADVPAIEGDAVRLAQVLSNLLNNAALYTPPGGRIAVGAAAERGEVTITVEDEGIGIAPETMERLFEPFTRIERGEPSGHGGLGLGLALARELVELHGGTIAAASEGLGQGSRFTVRLPAAGAEGAAVSPAPAGPRRTVRPRRVLVVDDNRDSARSLELLLTLMGHEAQVAHDGPGALAAVERERPDLVVLDLGLPEIDGLEVARRLRARPDGGELRLVALSGFGLESDRRRSIEAGFDAHLVKPLEPAALETLLAKLPERP